MAEQLDQYIVQHGKRLFGLCVHLCGSTYEAEDLYQETWLRVVKNLHRYDKNKPFEGWLTTICVNVYRDILRRKKITSAFHGMQEGLLGKDSRDELENIPALEQADYSSLYAAVRCLPDKLRITIILYYFYDLKETQVAETLGVPLGTIKSRLHKARELLRKEISRESEI